MSIYSGKCDVYDSFVMIPGSEEKTKELIKKTSFYIFTNEGLQKHKLDIHTYHDLIPYFPFLECIGVHSKEKSTVVLSRKSFVDTKEEEMLTFRLELLKKYYRKCKRNKKSFDQKEAAKNVFFSKNFDGLSEYEKELLNRVDEFGEKATIDGLHMCMHEYYRNRLYGAMRNGGYTDLEAYVWCFNEFPDKQRSRLNEENSKLF